MRSYQGRYVDRNEYELPKNIERYLAALCRLYARDGERLLQEIVVNAKIRIVEAWTRYENFGSADTIAHALYLVVPEPCFLAAADQRDDIQRKICADLNELHNFRGETVGEVLLEMDLPQDRDWREESGVLVAPGRLVTADSTMRIWGGGGFRLFLSHKSEVKQETATLKERLAKFGVSAFVAHADIKPTKAWQAEIENALHTMDAFAALMTERFHDSDWTDQEVGFALARGVPVIAVRFGLDPYGFIGKFQALRADWDDAPEGIISLLMKQDRMFSAYVRAMRTCTCWDDGNVLARALPGIEQASEKQIDDLVAAHNDNGEVRYSFGFRGNKRSEHGSGLIPHLHRLGPRRFVQDPNTAIISQAPVATRRQTVKDEIPF